jgi:hypothetical protein
VIRIADASFSSFVCQVPKGKERNFSRNSERIEIWLGAGEFLTPAGRGVARLSEDRTPENQWMMRTHCELRVVCG